MNAPLKPAPRDADLSLLAPELICDGKPRFDVLRTKGARVRRGSYSEARAALVRLYFQTNSPKVLKRLARLNDLYENYRIFEAKARLS